MEKKFEYMVIEFSYQFTYLYEYGNKLKKALMNILPSHSTNDDIGERIRFQSEDELITAKITPEETGIALIFDDPEDLKEETLKNYANVVSKVYSTVLSILEVENSLDVLRFNCRYVAEFQENDQFDKIKNELILTNRIKENFTKDLKDFACTFIKEEGECETSLKINQEEENVMSFDLFKTYFIDDRKG